MLGWRAVMTTLFEVPFTSAMSDRDQALLARSLDLCTNVHPSSSPEGDSQGVARLDHATGLFLECGPGTGQWLLQARTWGAPASSSVHEWHVLASGAAQELDRTVPTPERLLASPPQVLQRRVGRASNRRLTGLRRRLVGLD